MEVISPCPSAGKKRRVFQKSKKGKHCEQDGCVKARHFGAVSDGYMRFCGEHQKPGMVNLSRKRCEYENCAKTASQGCPIKRAKRFCAAHKEEGMINLVIKLCIVKNCGKTANYRSSNGGTKDYCTKHKGRIENHLHPGPTNATSGNNRVDEKDCCVEEDASDESKPSVDDNDVSSHGQTLGATQGSKKESPPLDVTVSAAEFSNPMYSSFSPVPPLFLHPQVPVYYTWPGFIGAPAPYPYGPPPLLHYQMYNPLVQQAVLALPMKAENPSDLQYRPRTLQLPVAGPPSAPLGGSTEKISSCGSTPCSGSAKEEPKSPLSSAKDGQQLPREMESRRICAHEGCSKARHFGFQVDRCVQFCGAHKEAGMVNLSRKMCEIEGCAISASHGCPIKRTKEFCATHKVEGMINLAKKLCLHPNCQKTANYRGSDGGKKDYCTKHKGVTPATKPTTKEVVQAERLPPSARGDHAPNSVDQPGTSEGSCVAQREPNGACLPLLPPSPHGGPAMSTKDPVPSSLAPGVVSSKKHCSTLEAPSADASGAPPPVKKARVENHDERKSLAIMPASSRCSPGNPDWKCLWGEMQGVK